MSRCPMVRLGDVLTRVERFEERREELDYPFAGTYSFARGLFDSGIKPGASFKLPRVQRIRAGDFVYCKIMAWEGAFGVVPTNLDGHVLSGAFVSYEIDTDSVEPQYLSWYFKVPAVWQSIGSASTGTNIRRRSLLPSVLESHRMALPPIEEQRRVVEQLNRVATQSARLGNLQEHVEGAADALLRARLNGRFGDPYRGVAGSAGFTDFAPIGELSSDVADGPHVTPQYVDDGVPFVTVLNITSGRVDFNRAKHITPAAHELYSKRAKAEPGDVLISKDGTLGVPCYVDTDREFSFFVSVALVKPRKDVLDGRFLVWALRAPYLQDRIAECSRGDMIRHLVLREVRQLLVPVVPLAEQRRIVSELDAAECQHRSLVARMRQSQDIATAIGGSMLSSAFSGS